MRNLLVLSILAALPASAQTANAWPAALAYTTVTSGNIQSYNLQIQDNLGTADVAQALVNANSSNIQAGGCLISWTGSYAFTGGPTWAGWSLMNDAGTAWLGHFSTGQATANSACRVTFDSIAPDAYGHLSMQFTISYLPPFPATSHIWVQTAGSNGVYYPWIQFNNPYQFSMTSISATIVPGPPESGFDDYNGGTVVLPDPNNPQHSLLKLPNGKRVSIPRADELQLSNFSWDFKSVGAATRYTYTLDDREVLNLRVGEDPRWAPTVTDQTAPEGWLQGLNNWSAAFPGKPVHSEHGEFSITSSWRPGLVAVFLQNSRAGEMFSVPVQEDTDSNLAIVNAGGIWGNSLMRFAIGPVFRPDVTPDEIRRIVKHWVVDQGFAAFQPFLDTGKADVIEPTTPLEQQALDCLREVLK